jgi:dTMP kinase
VIATRYYFSSLAYNCCSEADWGFVRRLNHGFPNPDLLIYLDLPVEIALKRIGDRQQAKREENQTDCYEQAEKLTQVDQNYQRIFRDYPDQYFRIDATLPVEDIHQQMIDQIEQLTGSLSTQPTQQESLQSD